MSHERPITLDNFMPANDAARAGSIDSQERKIYAQIQRRKIREQQRAESVERMRAIYAERARKA